MAVGSVELHVTDSNDAPTALNDFTILTRNSLATAIDVLANDSTAPDLGETLSITTVTQPANGTVVITGGGAGLTYQPNTAFTGLDFFTYLIDDGHGGTAPGNVSVNVVTVPLISFDTAFSSGSEKTKTVTITVNLFPPRLAPTTVEYAVVGGDATLIDDFKLLGTGVLKFKANRTTAKIELTVKNDTISDPYETVVVGLSNSSFGYSIGPIGQHTYTIIDDESIPSAPARFAADALFGLPWTGRKGKRWGLTPDSH
jgi:hypothetical protein